MATLADLKAEIADDLDRANLTSSISSEINKAIRFYQLTRFYFNETRDVTFNTVAGQKLYSGADDADIPKFIEIDQVNFESDSDIDELSEIFPNEWEILTPVGGSTGKPYSWAYFNQSIGIYPIPDQSYTVRLIGHISIDAPANDDDEGNVWMNEAFDLLRARVCAQLSQKKLRDPDGIQLYRTAEQDELTRLKGETSSRVTTGFVTPSQF